MRRLAGKKTRPALRNNVQKHKQTRWGLFYTVATNSHWATTRFTTLSGIIANNDQ